MSHNYADAWKRYLARITEGASNAAIARTLGINDGTVSRWMKAEVTPGLTTIIETARTLGDNPVQALRELGYITPQEASAHAVSRAFGLDAYTDLELAREIVRRIEAGDAEALTGDIDVAGTDDDVPVMSREAELALRKSDHRIAALRGRNEADIPHAE